MIVLIQLLIIHAATGVAPLANRAPRRSSTCSTITSASPAAPVATARRTVLAGTLATFATPNAASASDYAKAFAASTKLDADAFYAAHPYRSAGDVLDYIEKCAAPGDASAVLQAFEYFGKKYPMYSIGATKGKILDSAVAKAKPKRIVEVGSFLGYSAVRMAAKLPGDGMLACVEGNAEFARTAEGVVARAGLSDRVRFFVGLASDEISNVAKTMGRADLVFLDHCKECYAPDLGRMEAAVSRAAQVLQRRTRERAAKAASRTTASEAACLRKLADMLRRRTLGACRGLFQGLVRMAESGATKRAAKRKAAATRRALARVDAVRRERSGRPSAEAVASYVRSRRQARQVAALAIARGARSGQRMMQKLMKRLADAERQRTPLETRRKSARDVQCRRLRRGGGAPARLFALLLGLGNICWHHRRLYDRLPEWWGQ